MFYDRGLRALRLRDAEGRTACDEADEAGHRRLAEELLAKQGARLPGRGEVPALFRADDSSLLVCWDAMGGAAAGGSARSGAGGAAEDPMDVCGYRLQAAQMMRGSGASGSSAAAAAAAEAPRPSGWMTVAPSLPASATSFRVRGLAAATGYIFRLAAGSAFGWGQWGPASEVMLTRAASAAAAGEAAGAAGGGSGGGGGGGAGAQQPAVMFWGSGGGSAGRPAPPPPPQQQQAQQGAAAAPQPRGATVSPASSILRRSASGSSGSSASSASAQALRRPAAEPPRGAASDSDLRADFLRALQQDLEEQSAARRALEGAVARYTAAPGALEELSEEGLAALEGELEASLKAVRGAKERRIKGALGDEQSRVQCVVCLSAQKTSLFLPCKHLCACSDCAARILGAAGSGGARPACPLCRAPVEQVLDVYA
jgi:hypothetical protein